MGREDRRLELFFLCLSRSIFCDPNLKGKELTLPAEQPLEQHGHHDLLAVAVD